MLTDTLQTYKKVVDEQLTKLLKTPNKEYACLYKAMEYSLLAGGKRIRPILTMLTLDSLHVDWHPYLDLICSLEVIHTYSLIHDDLPAMDNDDYRRGRLTNHKVYGDGMATLAGDGLLTYAFECITDNRAAKNEQKLSCIEILAKAAGPAGMVGGQAYDLHSEGQTLSLKELQVLHAGKTGALFLAAIHMGTILGKASSEIKDAYISYAKALGLLFQITDDMLDVTGTMEELGKMPGSDEKEHKATYTSIFGLEGAKAYACETAEKAKQSLDGLEAVDTSQLVALIEYLLHRSA